MDGRNGEGGKSIEERWWGMSDNLSCSTCGGEWIPPDNVMIGLDRCPWCALAAAEARIRELEAEIEQLKVAHFYWDDRDLDRAVPPDEIGEMDDVGDVITLRPIHELPEVYVLIRKDGPYIFATQEEAEAVKGDSDG
jgi:hypothetical protein